MDDSIDVVDASDRKDNENADANQDVPMQFDEQNTVQGDSSHAANSNGNGSRSMDVDDVDSRGSNANTSVNANANANNSERDKINPFSRNRNNFNSGNDNSGYGIRDSPAVIVNTNLLPFIQKLHDPLRECAFVFI